MYNWLCHYSLSTGILSLLLKKNNFFEAMIGVEMQDIRQCGPGHQWWHTCVTLGHEAPWITMCKVVHIIHILFVCWSMSPGVCPVGNQTNVGICWAVLPSACRTQIVRWWSHTMLATFMASLRWWIAQSEHDYIHCKYGPTSSILMQCHCYLTPNTWYVLVLERC